MSNHLTYYSINHQLVIAYPSIGRLTINLQSNNSTHQPCNHHSTIIFQLNHLTITRTIGSPSFNHQITITQPSLNLIKLAWILLNRSSRLPPWPPARCSPAPRGASIRGSVQPRGRSLEGHQRSIAGVRDWLVK